MADRYYNPFQGIDIRVPVEFRDTFLRYCQTSTEGGRSIIDDSPFPRMVDFWFLAICVAAHHDLAPTDVSKYETYKVIEGSILSSDPWRIHALMLLAIGKTGDIEIVSEPRKIMALASGLAVAGLPRVEEMLKDGDAEPIWNISDKIDALLRKQEAV